MPKAKAKVKAEPKTKAKIASKNVSKTPTRRSSRSSVKAEPAVKGEVLDDDDDDDEEYIESKKEKKEKKEKKASVTKKQNKTKNAGVDLRTSSSLKKAAAALARVAAGAVAITAGDFKERPGAGAGAAAGRLNSIGGFKVSRESDDSVRYVIDLAKSDRAACKVDGTNIPKGGLRWSAFKSGVAVGGFRKLANVSSKILKNAVTAHRGLTNIHGVDSLPPDAAIEAIRILKSIAMEGSALGDKKKNKKGGKKKKKKAVVEEEGGGGGGGGNDDDDDDDAWIEMATLSLDEMLAKKLKEDKTAGRVMMIDCSSDEVSTLIN